MLKLGEYALHTKHDEYRTQTGVAGSKILLAIRAFIVREESSFREFQICSRNYNVSRKLFDVPVTPPHGHPRCSIPISINGGDGGVEENFSAVSDCLISDGLNNGGESTAGVLYTLHKVSVAHQVVDRRSVRRIR